MPDLNDKPTLSNLQYYIKQLCQERGWNNNTHNEIFLLFMEEVGELAKEIRRHTGLHLDKTKTKPADLAGEFADVLNYLFDLANYFDIDLEQAFRNKNKLNETRQWE